MAEPVHKLEHSEPEIDIGTDVDRAILACGGDVRAALKATLVANDHLGAEVGRLTALVSAGLVRGKLRRKPATEDDTKPANS